MRSNLRQILAEEGEGYQPNPDPKMLPREDGGEARFVEKHLQGDKTKITDIDPSTLDDKLFKASNIERAVPEPGENRHGHVPKGVDDKVYESLFSRLGLSEEQPVITAADRDTSALKVAQARRRRKDLTGGSGADGSE